MNTRIRGRLFEVIAIAIVASAMASPPSFAQEPAEVPPPEPAPTPGAEPIPAPVSGPRGIEEIVVTARKTEENIQDVPIAVTALTPERLQETGTFEMKDLGFRVPNLTTRYGPAQPTALVFQIRGQLQNDILGTLDPSIGFYDDGVYVARPHGANASFVDVRSVQVLRGPQGTLFGRNTTGGAVLLSTNDPDFEEISGSLGATVGSFGRRNFTGVLNAPILQDTLALRIVGEKLTTDGWAFDETNDLDIATEVHDLMRVKLRYDPFEGLDFVLNGQYININQRGLPLQPVFALKPTQAQQVGTCCLASLNSTAEGVDYDSFILGDPDRTDFDPGLDPDTHMTLRALTLTSTWDQPWATVKFIGGVRQNDDVANHIDIDGSPSKIVDTVQANQNLQQTYELQLTGSLFADRLNWAAGAVYFDESGEERGTTFALVPVAAAINPITTPGDIDNLSAGGYAQGTYSLTPKLRVTGGLRYSWDNKRLVLRSMMGNLCAIPEELRDDGTTCKATFDDSFDNVSFLAGTDYRLFEDTPVFDDVLIYVSISTGYRAGGQNLRGTAVNTLTPFKPETLMQFEAGFKSELLGRSIRLNGAGFYTLYDDIQRSIIISSGGVLPATVVSNAASADIAGTEVELTALPPIEGVELGASLGVVQASYNEFMDVTGDRTDEKFDSVPDMTYSLSGGYTRGVFGVPWTNRLDWSWLDDVTYGQGENKYFRNQGVELAHLTDQPAVGFLNARSAVSFANGLEVGVFGKNLTDERTWVTLVLGGGPDFVTRIINNPGREFGGDITYRF